MDEHELPVVVIGAGPAGWPRRRTCVERGWTPLVLEAGPSAGTSVRRVAPRAAVLPVGRAGRPGGGEAAGPDRLAGAGPGPVPDRRGVGASGTCSRSPTRSASASVIGPGSSGSRAAGGTAWSTPAGTPSR